jgi:hypothetical protein
MTERNGTWKTFTFTLAGMLATGISAWLVFAQQAVTRNEVVHLISRETPYLEDRKAIQEALARNHEGLNRLREDIDCLRIQQYRMESKLDALMGKESHMRARPRPI